MFKKILVYLNKKPWSPWSPVMIDGDGDSFQVQFNLDTHKFNFSNKTVYLTKENIEEINAYRQQLTSGDQIEQ
jgi:hypothetical protein